MQISSIGSKISPEEMPLQMLAHNSQLSETDKIAGASRHFEAVLLRQFLNEAYQPMMNTQAGGNGATNEIYKDMVVNVLAEEISRTKMLGLAQHFQAQLVMQNTNKDKAGGETPATE